MYHIQRPIFYHNKIVTSTKVTEWLPTQSRTYSSHQTQSWFYASEFNETFQHIISPTHEQRVILSEWFNAFIEMYNKTIDYIQKLFDCQEKYLFSEQILNFCKLRYHLSDVQNYILAGMTNIIPPALLVEAIRRAVQSCKDRIARFNKTGKKIRLRKISHAKKRKVLVIPNRFLNDTTFCHRIFESTTILNDVTQAIILQYETQLGEYKLIIPGKKDDHISCASCDKVATECGVDPGCRTFMTTFSNDDVYLIGTKITKRLEEYYIKIHEILNRLHNSMMAIIERNELKRICQKYYNMVANMVDDLHYKTAYLMVTKYDNIYLGKFRPMEILAQKNNLSDQARWILRVLDHDTFRVRLNQLADKYGAKIYEVDEYLTTKTCSGCGNIADVHGEIYECDRCKIRTYRDVNAAKNILKIGKQMNKN